MNYDYDRCILSEKMRPPACKSCERCGWNPGMTPKDYDKTEIIFDYDDVRKADDVVSCRIFKTRAPW